MIGESTACYPRAVVDDHCPSGLHRACELTITKWSRVRSRGVFVGAFFLCGNVRLTNSCLRVTRRFFFRNGANSTFCLLPIAHHCFHHFAIPIHTTLALPLPCVYILKKPSCLVWPDYLIFLARPPSALLSSSERIKALLSLPLNLRFETATPFSFS